MKKKIVGILVCTLLITTALPAIGTINEKTITSTEGIESVPVIDFRNPRIFQLGKITIDLVNYKGGNATDIEWEMKITEGEFFWQGKYLSPKDKNGTIPDLGPEGKEPIIIDMSGFGITTIVLNCKYKIEDLPECDVEFEVKQEWRIIGLMSLFIFPPNSPQKKWPEIEEFSYVEDADYQAGEFYVEGINNMHNVRVVSNVKSDSSHAEFLAACKFTNGNATLEECWLTKDLVEREKCRWELETIVGKD